MRVKTGVKLRGNNCVPFPIGNVGGGVGGGMSVFPIISAVRDKDLPSGLNATGGLKTSGTLA